MTPDTRVSRARTRLLLDSPWFGSLSMRLRVESTSDCKTMETDGTRLRFNPQFVESLSDVELTGVMAHEVMHCALLHPYRLGKRDFRQWNEACDYAINQLLIDQGFTLPEGALLDEQFKGMGAEQIYAVRERQKQQEEQQQPQPQDDGQQDDGSEQPQAQDGDGENEDDAPSSFGEVTAPSEASAGESQSDGAPQEMTATDWQVATEQATAVAKKAGSLPADADRAVKAARQSETNWREILRRFVDQTVPSDYSWTQPNRRYVAQGIYLPGTVRENMPRFAVGIDTSGSIQQSDLAMFAAELTQILHETRPESIDVYYCDTRVCHTESFSPDDPEITLSAHGGGGTSFQPVFDRIADESNEPAALIYFTDLEGPTPIEPGYPVLWVTSEASNLNGPFGETVRISKWS